MAAKLITDLGISNQELSTGAFLSASTYVTLDVGVSTSASLQVSFFNGVDLIVALEAPVATTLVAGAPEKFLTLENIKVPRAGLTTRDNFEADNPGLIIAMPGDFTPAVTAGVAPATHVQVGIRFTGTPTGSILMRRTMLNRGTNVAAYAPGGSAVGGDGPVVANTVETDTTNFNNNLSAADDTVQKALDTIDDMTVAGGTGTVTSVATGTGLDGLITSTGTITLNLNELPIGGTLLSTDYLVAVNGTANQKQLISSIPLSIFNDNLGYSNYTHPTYAGDDFSVDTGPLTGAIVVSDIDINVTTDAQGHVTDANGVVVTRTLTAANIGALSTTGKAADSNLLDGIDSTQFLRSDVSDTASGTRTFTGNIVVGGTVDGRDVAADGTKLDALPTHSVQIGAPVAPATGDVWFDTDEIPTFSATTVVPATAGFNNNLSAADNTVQKALDTLDNMSVVADDTTLSGKSIWTSTNNWDVVPYTDTSGITHAGDSINFYRSDTLSDYGFRMAIPGVANGYLQFFDDASTQVFALGALGAGVPSGMSMYFDNFSNTYIQENTADNLRMVTGGVERFNVNSSGVQVVGSVNISADIYMTGIDSSIAIQGSGATNGRVIAPGGAFWTREDGTAAEAIAIKLPTAILGQSDMVSFWIDVMAYGNNIAYSIFISSYVYQGAGLNTWHNNTIIVEGHDAFPYTIRLADDGTRPVVYIGELTTVHSYPKVQVRDLQVGFTASAGLSSWANGWQITGESVSFGSVDSTFAAGAYQGYSSKSGTATTATNANNADLLDNINSTSFLRSDVADTATAAINFSAGLTASTIDVAGRALFDSGTVSLPSISFSGDPDTGIYQSSGSNANNMYFATQGVRRLIVDGGGISVTGNIGVSGTVDGRDIAADGTKLDGISANARTGTVTSVSTGAGLSGTITAAGTITMDLNGLPAGGTLLATDSIVSVNGTASQKQLISSIPLSIFNDDIGAGGGGGDADTLGTRPPWSSGNNGGQVPYVDNGLIMRIGAYLDFHSSDATTTRAGRLTSAGTQLTYANSAGVPQFSVDNDGDIGIPTGTRIFLDGTANTGNTYIQENTADNIRFVAGGIERFNINSAGIGIAQGVNMYFDGVSNNGNTYIDSDTTDNLRMVAGGSERLNVNSSGCQVIGTLTATTVNATSDRSLKKNIEKYTSRHAHNIQAVSFDWIGGAAEQVGYIAQSVEKEMPAAVSEEEGIKAVNYSMVHTAKIAELEDKVSRLERLIMELLHDNTK